VITEVAAALIQDSAGRYLITRRREGTHLAGLWEFPGGKCQAGETFEACLRRELGEELGASFTVGEKVETVRWEYPATTIVIHFFRCRLVAGRAEPLESQALAWVAPEQLADYEFPAADASLVGRLRSRTA